MFACSVPGVLTNVPAVAVTLTATVQPPAGMAKPAAMVIVAGAGIVVSVAFGQVPRYFEVVVMPAGRLTVNGEVSNNAVAFVFTRKTVSVGATPDGSVPGAMVCARYQVLVVTVSDALGAG